jgi:probable F420-dependent oxidoreductase
MRFGLAAPNFRELATPEFLRRFSQCAEEFGYDSLWVADHLVVPVDVEAQFGSTFYEPFTTLAYLAGMTGRIRLGVSAAVLPYRNPVHQAKIISTLDALSGGRAIIAVAAGWSEAEMRALGAPFHRRGAVTDEYLQVFRELWRNPPPSFDGRTVKVSGVVFEPKPMQDPFPLWGAGNSAAAIRRAARFCQGWHPRRRTVQEVRDGVRLLSTLADAFGRGAERFEVAPRVPLAFDRRPGASGFPITGSADEIAAWIARYEEAGATYLVLDTFGSAEVGDLTPQQVLDTLQRFAAEVMPRFAERR